MFKVNFGSKKKKKIVFKSKIKILVKPLSIFRRKMFLYDYYLDTYNCYDKMS